MKETNLLMETASPRRAARELPLTRTAPRLPLGVKIGYTLFMGVLLPVYWRNYGATNFLYFCDVALLLTLAAVWTESALMVSMAAVGILVPQTVWVADFLAHLAGFKLVGMTDYMFNAQRPLFLRGLSLFHGWLPFLLVWLTRRLGYDRRALPAWTLLAWTLMAVCFFLMPAPPAPAAHPNTPVNINYVFGLSDEHAQTWMAPGLYLATMMIALPLVFYWPTHRALRWAFRRAEGR